MLSGNTGAGGAGGAGGSAGAGGASACGKNQAAHCLNNDKTCKQYSASGVADVLKAVCNQNGTWTDGSGCPKADLGCCSNPAVKYDTCYYTGTNQGSAKSIKTQCEKANGTWCS